MRTAFAGSLFFIKFLKNRPAGKKIVDMVNNNCYFIVTE